MMIKIAAVSDDGENLSRHFGRATKYVVVTIDKGVITGREIRLKLSNRDIRDEPSLQVKEPPAEYRVAELDEPGLEGKLDESHGRGYGARASARHKRMLDNIPDCEIILAGGMGRGLYESLKAQTIYPIITDMANIDEAIQAIIADKINFRLDRIH